MNIDQTLKGLNFLITAGPTIEEIDPVRYISNFSSGKQGYEMASILAKKGGNVTLISGPTNLNRPENVNFVSVKTAVEMYESCMSALAKDKIDCLIAVAAVSDFRVDNKSERKLNRRTEDGTITLKLVANPDILSEIGNNENLRPKLVIGFALESEDLIEKAEDKRLKKNCDWIVANLTINQPFENDTNNVFLIKDQAIKEYHNKTKREIAKMIAQEISLEFVTA